ncbi:hypothetical protein FFLO_01659 [Filobasidium floriforme]|uniref:HCP-like protein n=1 Tax=Filobasidium floriforme TaxID=5210 RepID=A0A8K0NSI6_9TREE|nr:uncharacterized protein HD553DRAFT_276054 [Filobasidium floriforme]KAG7562969.1 hypothetical protein FFLO_01659 [Filobasidium floriforme]KAH8080578.1 hypothetical protein HD553DRAFT_276054 [Filobasidium floriforme]
MPEPYEERTGRRQTGPFAGQTKSPTDRDGRAVTFEAGAKQPGYVPPLSDHLSPNQAHLGSTSAASQPSAEDYLQMGIDKHEKSQGDEELSESAHYFRKAAEGGSAAGCVFYGLALRHGWGVQRDEKQAFGWLEMGCATVMQKPSTDIVDLDRRQSLMPMGTQNKLSAEVIMAIYEVGNCFEHAWGVPGTKRNQPNHQMAAMYYRLGAEQGDRDNQEHLANLLSQGKYGLKKDMWEAAFWYRAAIDNGLSPIGLSWVYKVRLLANQIRAGWP